MAEEHGLELSLKGLLLTEEANLRYIILLKKQGLITSLQEWGSYDDRFEKAEAHYT